MREAIRQIAYEVASFHSISFPSEWGAGARRNYLAQPIKFPFN